jgi:hypothetical protein
MPRKKADTSAKKDLQDWIKQQLDDAVYELMERGVVQSLVVEAKPAWVFPFTVLIGKIRDQSRVGSFDWFICAEGAPTRCASSAVVPTVREAARHFALKWQLDAARMEQGGEALTERAEALYRWFETDELWPESEHSQGSQ